MRYMYSPDQLSKEMVIVRFAITERQKREKWVCSQERTYGYNWYVVSSLSSGDTIRSSNILRDVQRLMCCVLAVSACVRCMCRHTNHISSSALYINYDTYPPSTACLYLCVFRPWDKDLKPPSGTVENSQKEGGTKMTGNTKTSKGQREESQNWPNTYFFQTTNWSKSLSLT